MIMLKIKISFRTLILILITILLVGLAACSADVPSETPSLEEPGLETEIPSTLEAPPTSPPPELQPTVLLTIGEQVDSFLITQTQAMLEHLVETSSMKLISEEGLTPEMVTPEVQVVVGVGQNLDLNALAAQQPGLSFVAIGNPGAVVTDNVSVIGNPSVEAQQLAFLAGYLSAVVSKDNKIAALIAEENPMRDFLAESYQVGARFYCGICHPVFPPYNTFPKWEIVSSTTAASDFVSIIDSYANIGVDVMFVHGALFSPELLDYMEELGVKVVSDRSPDILRSNWAGTLVMDPAPALEALWLDLLAVAPGKQAPSSMVLMDLQMGLVSPGRQRLFEGMVAELQSGMVSLEIAP